MNKWMILGILFIAAIATATDISHTTLVSSPLLSTDRVPMGRPSDGHTDGHGTAYTLSVGQVMNYVQTNYSSTGAKLDRIFTGTGWLKRTGTATYTVSTPTYSDVGAAPAFTSYSANHFLAGPSGSSGVPSQRNIVAADIPTLNQDTTGSALYWKTTGTGKAGITGPATGTTRTYTFPDDDATILTSTASGIQTFLTTPSSANLAAAVTDETGSGALVFGTSPTFTTQITTPSVLATSNDSGALGASGTAFSDLFLASGGVINWNAGNATLTHSTGLLTSNVTLAAPNFALTSGGGFTVGSVYRSTTLGVVLASDTGSSYDFYLSDPLGNAILRVSTGTLNTEFGGSIKASSLLATSNDSGALGASGAAFSDLFLASGGVINWNAGNATITHSTGLLTSNVALSAPRHIGTVSALTTGATVALNAALGDYFTLTPDQNLQINASNALAGQTIKLKILTSGTSSYTITFGTNFVSTGTLATGSADAKTFIVVFACFDGTNFVEVSRTTAM